MSSLLVQQHVLVLFVGSLLSIWRGHGDPAKKWYLLTLISGCPFPGVRCEGSLEFCLIARETTRDSWTWVCIWTLLYGSISKNSLLVQDCARLNLLMDNIDQIKIVANSVMYFKVYCTNSQSFGKTHPKSITMWLVSPTSKQLISIKWTLRIII